MRILISSAAGARLVRRIRSYKHSSLDTTLSSCPVFSVAHSSQLLQLDIMAASCMTKAFLGSSLAKAVPTQGKASPCSTCFGTGSLSLHPPIFVITTAGCLHFFPASGFGRQRCCTNLCVDHPVHRHLSSCRRVTSR